MSGGTDAPILDPRIDGPRPRLGRRDGGPEPGQDAWAGGLLLATPPVFGVALIGGRKRPGLRGFAVLGGAYYVLAFLGLFEGNLAKLPTSRVLWYVHEQVATPAPRIHFYSRYVPTGGPSVMSPNVSPRAKTLGYGDAVTPEANFDFYASDRPQPIVPDLDSPNRWRAAFPGAANLEAFQAVGHCLFALVAGMVGAAVGRWFERRATP